MPHPQPPTPPILSTFDALLSKRRKASAFRTLVPSPPTSADFSSNDFLSLSTSSALRTSFLQELSSDAPFRLGSGGSRLLDGNSVYAERLERDIADFHRGAAGLLFNSGFDANSGFFACVPQPGDIILFDEAIHASVHDGMRLARTAIRLPVRHNSVTDLRRVLQEQIGRDSLVLQGKRNVFIATESVYSMDGDRAPLVEIVELVERLLPAGNGLVIVDEAHATGVFGPQGRGLVSQLGLENRIFARLHTFGKALACGGAIIICDPLTRQYLINYARPMIYTTFMSFPNLAAIRVVYTFLQQGKSEPLANHLFSLLTTLHTLLTALLFTLPTPTSNEPLLSLPTTPPTTPILSLFTPHPRSLAKHCQDGGFVVRAIVPPTVAPGTQRVRVCLHAGNTVAEVERLVEKIGEWVASMGSDEGRRLGGVVAERENGQGEKARL